MPSSNKSLIDHIKEHHHRFHFFFVLIIATSISLGIYIGSLAQTQISLPASNHPMGLTYYLDNLFYGNFRGELDSTVNTYLIWHYYMNAGPDPQSIFDSFSLQSVPKILSGLACYFVRFALILVGIAVILSGITFIFSRGNPTAFANAKKNLLYVIIGGLVIYGVYTIILSVSLFVASSTALPWIPLTCS